MEQQQPPTSAGLVIPGLVVVLVTGRVFIGRVKGGVPTAGMSFALNDALELLGGVVPMPGGQMKTECIPAPIHPFNKPTTINVKPDVIIDAREDNYLCNMFSAVTGNRGLVIPGVG